MSNLYDICVVYCVFQEGPHDDEKFLLNVFWSKKCAEDYINLIPCDIQIDYRIEEKEVKGNIDNIDDIWFLKEQAS